MLHEMIYEHAWSDKKMDWGWTPLVSPVAVVLLGWWMKHADEERGRSQVAAAAAAKIAAEGAAALARENIRQVLETHRTLQNVESNVNGRFSQQSEIARLAQIDNAHLRTEIANLKISMATLLERRPEDLEKVREVITAPISPPPDLPPAPASVPSMTGPEEE